MEHPQKQADSRRGKFVKLRDPVVPRVRHRHQSTIFTGVTSISTGRRGRRQRRRRRPKRNHRRAGRAHVTRDGHDIRAGHHGVQWRGIQPTTTVPRGQRDVTRVFGIWACATCHKAGGAIL
jgi:hypothetical protein